MEKKGILNRRKYTLDDIWETFKEYDKYEYFKNAYKI